MTYRYKIQLNMSRKRICLTYRYKNQLDMSRKKDLRDITTLLYHS